MKRTKEDAKGLFKNIRQAIKQAFSAEPQKAAFAGATAAYNIANSGAVVYVDISDDNIPDIDQGDKVYADAQETVPYPDGTYTVADATGQATQFSFTVVAGTVTMVNDIAGTGPGAPIQAAPAPQAAPQTAPQQQQIQPVIAPQGAPQPQGAPLAPRFSIVLPSEFEAFKGLFKDEKGNTSEDLYKDFHSVLTKFANGSTEERVANLETMCKGLMMYCFGYRLQDLDQQAAISTYITTNEQMQTQLTQKTTQLEALKESNEKLIELFEEFLDVTPTSTPVTLQGKAKERFEKEQKKDQFRDRIAANLKEIKESKKK